ncbi:dienelactone hydrolase family protein [Saccharomonospora glauca]|jgi:carboxymethylenebutenolidase|uniref:Dienelactone hydrolase-like enzyme n=1 Tax=Saccharomonospora glauca K62 TaxID=928724 RepID=I1CWY4_9PSEU|nr:dienelactone hydrolase family protein [Saccharomonospora glauca]EIE97208.1 dienelactone hydrolase-like enzyme [Saccharomonospora glauca K62]
MTQTHTQDYERTDGRRLRLTYAEPDGAVRGGLVVLHEVGGVTDAARLLVASLAAEGWLAAAPHIDEVDTEAERGAGSSLLAATDTTLAWLVDHGVRGDQVGVVGFDLGGTAALVVAANRKLGAAVSVGGRGIGEPAAPGFPTLLDIAGTLTSPWLGLYGDDGDAVEQAEIDKLREEAGRAKVATNVVRYAGASHRFDADPEAAAEAWQRTLAWFDAHLR